MKPKPVDPVLYAKVKQAIYAKNPKHSAYRSGHVVRAYKKQFSQKYGKKKSPYMKAKKTIKKGLTRWFAEKWVNQRGKVGYKYKNDIYRPTYRITKDTPLTHNELTPSEIKRARKIKATKKRVYRFRPFIKTKMKTKTKKRKTKTKKRKDSR
tara:strand:+ start:793 stop:1248 length:456 start_codon:yes stop_codon:yes gene_type:complete